MNKQKNQDSLNWVFDELNEIIMLNPLDNQKSKLQKSKTAELFKNIERC